MTSLNGTVQKLEGFVKEQLEEAQERIHTLEEGAERVMKNLRVRSHRSRKELGTLLHTLRDSEFNLLQNPKVKQLGERAEQAGAAVRKRFDELQTRVVEAAGVATQSQVKEISRELGRLTRKVNALVSKKTGDSAERPN